MFVGSKKATKRFSLLLLEEGDDYVQDWVANCRPLGGPSTQTCFQNKLRGRLRLCSKSFFFEPEDVKVPIFMFQFRKVQRIEEAPDPTNGTTESRFKARSSGSGFLVEINQVVKMKESGLDAPYIYEKGQSLWWFSLEYAPVSQFLQQSQELMQVNALPYGERDMVLNNAAARREAAAKFDISRLADLSERLSLDLPAAQVTPLVREPGRLVVTQSRLYFQPSHNLNNDSPVRSHPLSIIAAVARRRHALRSTGMEVFFGYDEADRGSGSYYLYGPGSGASTDGPSAFFTFLTLKDRERAMKAILEHIGGSQGTAASAGSLLEAGGAWLPQVTTAWQQGLVSNFDYLVYLNLAAGRTCNDLTQWPVFPWILADYKSSKLDLTSKSSFRDLSKPVGALNPARLKVFKERYNQMPKDDPDNPPFLYGTHYSAPGYVLYWLVRAAPAHMLRLQMGKFDAPDRLFLSIADAWDSVLSNFADVKELIPQFFSLPADFLVNKGALNLGVRQNGTPVGDVVLPPWADGPEDFVLKHRQALESEYVSANLHHWVDLIFGCKQRGEAALQADNLFHHLTYEGAVDLESITDPTVRAGLEAQIHEFGQAPRQLFAEPHPAREVAASKPAAHVIARGPSNSTSQGSRAMSVELLSRIMVVVGISETPTISPPSHPPSSPPKQAPPSPPQPEDLDIQELDALLAEAESSDDEPVLLNHGSQVLNNSSQDPPNRSLVSNNRSQEPPVLDNRAQNPPLSDSRSQGLRVVDNGDPEPPAGVLLWGGRRSSGSGDMSGKLGLRLALDLVKEEADSASPWSQKARASRTSSKTSNSDASQAETRPQESNNRLPLHSRSTSVGEMNYRRSSSANSHFTDSAPDSPSLWARRANSPQLQPLTLPCRPSVDIDEESSAREGSEEAGFSGRRADASKDKQWHWMLRQRLSEPAPVKIHRGPANALLLSDRNGTEAMTMYSAGNDGFVKVYSLTEGFQIRATKLGNLPLASLALAASSEAHPTVLAGSYDNCVYAYSVDYGRILGKLRAHDDTVSCVRVAEGEGGKMVTASWDATVKVWAVEEGKGGWGGAFGSAGVQSPVAELVENESAIWALDLTMNGNVVVSGAEDGSVIAWDLRIPGPSLWHSSVAQGAVSGLRLCGGERQLAVSALDGRLRLLDLRKEGAELAAMGCGSPLRCCDEAGGLVVAGSDEGMVHFWPHGVPIEDSQNDPPGGANDYLDFSPLNDHNDVIKCICLAGGVSSSLGFMASASEDSTIQVYKVGDG